MEKIAGAGPSKGPGGERAGAKATPALVGAVPSL
jgi:hypothetical protein